MKHRALFILSTVILFCSACSFQREPGPAERIGRSLDEIADSVTELSEKDQLKRDAEEKKRREEAARYNYESEQDPSQRDPYYDSYDSRQNNSDREPFDSRRPSSSDDWRDEQRY